jgi:hypothetical protein
MGDSFRQMEQLLLLRLSQIWIQIWSKIQGRQKLLEPSRIKFKYLEV